MNEINTVGDLTKVLEQYPDHQEIVLLYSRQYEKNMVFAINAVIEVKTENKPILAIQIIDDIIHK